MLKSAVKAIELMLLSAGAITTLLILKGETIPYSCELVSSSLIGFWNTIRCFLSSPLCICIIINFMVVLIAVSSHFHHHETKNHDDGITVNLDDHDVQTFKPQPPPAPPPRQIPVATPSPPLQVRSTKITTTTTKILQNSSEKSILSSPKPIFPNWDLTQESKKTTNPLNQKLKMGSRNSPQGEVTDSDKENEEEDTMEATWKLIIGGGNQTPKKKELKKSETWVLPPRTNNSVQVQQMESDEFLPSVKWKELRKSETFNDTVSIRRNGGLRRDPSVGLDDINKQVEAFIKKFNADMRLQRQESDQRLLEMIS